MIKSWDIFLAIFETYSNYTLTNTIHDPSYQRPSYFPIPFATSQEKMGGCHGSFKTLPNRFPQSPRYSHRGAFSHSTTTRSQQGTKRVCQGDRQNRIRKMQPMPFRTWDFWWKNAEDERHNLNWWFKHTSVLVKHTWNLNYQQNGEVENVFTKKKVHLKNASELIPK